MQDQGMKAERKFTDVARAGIGIENFIEGFGVIRRGMNNFSLVKLEMDLIKSDAAIKRRRIKSDVALYRIFDRTGKNFSIWNIEFSTTGNGSNFFNAKPWSITDAAFSIPSFKVKEIPLI